MDNYTAVVVSAWIVVGGGLLYAWYTLNKFEKNQGKKKTK